MLAADAGTAAEIATTNVDSSITAVVSEQTALKQSIVFIDSDLKDSEILLDGLSSANEIVLLDPTLDAIDQITSVLSQRSNLAQVHVVTHGQSGAVLLGNQQINEQTLSARGEQVRSWSNSLTADADILLYGCSTGQGRAGTQFVAQLAKLTGADVAASSDLTGHRFQGGDWEFELQTGHIESLVAFDVVSRNRFQNTLNITVNATGQRGEEQFELLVDNIVVRSWVATDSPQSYVYGTSEPIQANQVEVRFVNDLYEPENGIDRNLTIDNIVIDGVAYESESSTTFSTGTWLSTDGVTAGFGRGDVLHANGSFLYDVRPTEPLVWCGENWTNDNPRSDTFVDIAENELVISSDESASVWRTEEMEAGDVYRFTVDAYKQFFTSSSAAGSQAPFASVGIDFRDAQGNEIDELIIETNSTDPSVTATAREFVAPDGTAFATLWAWQGDSPEGARTDLRIREVSIEQIDLSDDTTPPTAEFNPDNTIPLVFNNADDSLSFVNRYTDDVRLGTPAQVRVTGPNGYDQIAVAFTGDGNGITQINTLHGIFPEQQGTPTRDWGSQDNGEYTVILEPNSLSDQAGNVTPGQILGTFTVSIGDETDSVPPTARLRNTTSQVNAQGEAQFLLVYQDNVGPVSFANDGLPTVTVTGPGGYEAGVNGFAGGPGEGANETIEAFVLPPGPNGYVAGEYFVSLNEGRILDESGNAAPAGLLGSFQLILG